MLRSQYSWLNIKPEDTSDERRASLLQVTGCLVLLITTAVPSSASMRLSCTPLAVRGPAYVHLEPRRHAPQRHNGGRPPCE
jgi:hypothetical protein